MMIPIMYIAFMLLGVEDPANSGYKCSVAGRKHNQPEVEKLNAAQAVLDNYQPGDSLIGMYKATGLDRKTVQKYLEERILSAPPVLRERLEQNRWRPRRRS